YERFFEADGVRYHHIITPQTGYSAKGVQSVTILGANALLTDALSTSIFVLGAEEGMALVDRLDDVEAIIIDRQGELLTSSGLGSLDKR
ncbi:MAG: FAD:protein FMN transferase, partial [Candidatus Thiodiazotropha sp. (ex. Lucinisca nassula)]|nr:FAD:protein FMN transferase [Candidatus Thiodiazotropha sp. (ex. Lucinisca nassula)]